MQTAENKITQSPNAPNKNAPDRVPFFQAKLTINAPGDEYEQEADRMADHVMRMPATSLSFGEARGEAFFKPKPVSISRLQRKCKDCEDEEKLHRKESSSQPIESGNEVSSYIGSLSSKGSPLPYSAKSFFEPRFGRDFSEVKIHNDNDATKSSQSVNALAYTVCNNIVFNQNQFSPESDGGKKLLAHELTHVVQQEPQNSNCSIQRRDDPSSDPLPKWRDGRIRRVQRALRKMNLYKGDTTGKLDQQTVQALDKILPGWKKRDQEWVISWLNLKVIDDSNKPQVQEPSTTSPPATDPQAPVAPTAPKSNEKAGGTVFHPGIMHDHQATGKWEEVQANPDSAIGINSICRHSPPEGVIVAAGLFELRDKPMAAEHLSWFLSKGSGSNFDENTNLDLLLRTDSGAQAKIRANIPVGQSKGIFTGYVAISQDDYDDDEFKDSFGQIDRLDFEIDFDAGTFHAWFQDRYEWHPVYPFYKKYPDDYSRGDNCVHAAAVELKSGTARDYWMKGEVTMPLSALESTGYRWQTPKTIY
jgi:hypothetical protein